MKIFQIEFVLALIAVIGTGCASYPGRQQVRTGSYYSNIHENMEGGVTVHQSSSSYYWDNFSSSNPLTNHGRTVYQYWPMMSANAGASMTVHSGLSNNYRPAHHDHGHDHDRHHENTWHNGPYVTPAPSAWRVQGELPR